MPTSCTNCLAYLVKVYHNGAIYPTVINPCRTELEALKLKARLDDRIAANGWNHQVTIEKKTE